MVVFLVVSLKPQGTKTNAPFEVFLVVSLKKKIAHNPMGFQLEALGERKNGLPWAQGFRDHQVHWPFGKPGIWENGCGCQHILVGEFATHFRTYFSEDCRLTPSQVGTRLV